MSRRFLTPSKIPRYLMCSICSEVFRHPVRLNCSHTFCKECIQTWLKSQKSCPICRTACKARGFSSDLIANSAVGELEVICQNGGCVWTGPLNALEKHETLCKYHPDRLEPWISSKIPCNNIGEDEDLEKPEPSLVCSLYEQYACVMKRLFTIDDNSTVFNSIRFESDSEIDE